MKKLYFEYYDGKYCKIPTDLHADPISPNHKLEYWVFRNKDTNKYLKCVESELGVPSYSFTADSHKDDDIVCIVPGGIGLSNMLESSEDPEEITLEYLGRDNVELIPYFKEIMWVKIDGKKVYNDNRTTWDKFCVSALNIIPPIPEGKVWDGYYMGSQKVDGDFVFAEWMAGCNIESRFHDQVNVTTVYMVRGKEFDRKVVTVMYGEEVFVNIPYKDQERFKSSEFAYKDEGCTIKIEGSIKPTEHVTVYMELTKIHEITLINKALGYAKNDHVLDGRLYGDFQDGTPALFGFNYEGLYRDEKFHEKYQLPMIINRNMTFYVNFVREDTFTLRIDYVDYIGEYNKLDDTYVFELKDIDDSFVGIRVSDLFNELLIKPGHVLGESYVVLQLPAKYSVGVKLEPVFAEPLTWKLLPTFAKNGKLIPYVNPIEVEIQYNTYLGSYYAPISLPKIEFGDYEEPDSQIALTGRVFMDNGCTRTVVSPTIEGNNVYAGYTARPDFTLPDAHLKLDRKPSMSPTIIDTAGGEIEPREFIVATDQILKLSKEMFTMTPPEGKVFDKFSYTDPYTNVRKEFKLPYDLKVEYSYNIITHWDYPIQAILIVDEGDRDKDIIFTGDNTDELEFTIPHVYPKKDGWIFVGWSGLPERGEIFKIKETEEFYPIWEPEDHKPVPLEV